MAVLLLRPLMEVSMVFINNNGLIDLGFQGNKYTWSNKWTTGTIKQRLDRSIANDKWRILFSRANLLHNLSVRHLYCVSVTGYKYMCVPVQGYACTDAGGACAGDKVSV